MRQVLFDKATQVFVFKCTKLNFYTKKIVATNTNTVVAPKVKVSKFSKLFLQIYKTYSSLMKQSYRFERFLFSSVDDISVQLRYRELNDTKQALFSSSLLYYRQVCTPNDVRRPNLHVLAARRISHIFGPKWPTSMQEN